MLPGWFAHIAKFAGGFDLLHGNGISDLTLARTGTPQVVTIHHLSASSVKALHPSLFQRLKQPGGELGLVPYLEPVVVRRAGRIIAVSEYTLADLAATLGMDMTHISVIRHGAHPQEYRFSRAELAETRAQI